LRCGGGFQRRFFQYEKRYYIVTDFIADRKLFNCCDIHRGRKVVSYSNEALGHVGLLDYFFVSDSSQVLDINVIDPDVNFSDLLPVMLTICTQHNHAILDAHSQCSTPKCTTLCLDHADILSYYNHSRFKLEPLLARAAFLYDNRHVISFSEATTAIESLYSEVVSVLHEAATLFIPSTCKNACKFRWSCQLSPLNADSVNANRMWISVGKPRSSPIFST
jgi:hypothetical protein